MYFIHCIYLFYILSPFFFNRRMERIIINCKTHNLSLLYMQIEQLQRRYYEVGTKEGPNLLGRFLSTIGI